MSTDPIPPGTLCLTLTYSVIGQPAPASLFLQGTGGSKSGEKAAAGSICFFACVTFRNARDVENAAQPIESDTQIHLSPQ